MPEREWSDFYDDTEILRPLLRWTEEQIFESLKSHGVPPNPLYLAGFARVGCYPCIHFNKGSLARMEEWAWEKLAYWEKLLGRTWFPPGEVPGVHITKIEDVRKWCRTKRGGKEIDPELPDAKDVPSCMGTWGVCE
jgi:3'-phosphoadenosine 5'-phosphosulfate sulfotransferase (PAPS reductase)/FAD synthetase